MAPKENLAQIQKALQEGGNQDFQTKELPGLNHLFQHAPTGSPTEYGGIEETMAPEALSAISDWLAEHATPLPNLLPPGGFLFFWAGQGGCSPLPSSRGSFRNSSGSFI